MKTTENIIFIWHLGNLFWSDESICIDFKYPEELQILMPFCCQNEGGVILTCDPRIRLT